jgi:hypothetical protein
MAISRILGQNKGTGASAGFSDAAIKALIETKMNEINANIASIPTNVWGYATRTINFPTTTTQQVASDVLKVSADIERNTVSGAYTKIKEVRIASAGGYRIKFALKSGTGGATSYGKIYKNGVAFGTERTTTSTTYTTYSEDLTVSGGDLIQLYIHGNTVDTAYGKEFRAYSTVNNTDSIIQD